MSGRAHIPYWNTVLQEDYCHADGEPWPCLHHRQTLRHRCECSHGPGSHTGGHGRCWFLSCACLGYRDPLEAAMDRHPAGKAIPARFDERYDPSPEPIDRQVS